MPEQELREKIAQEIGEWRWKDNFYGDYVTENDRNSCRVETGLIFDLIKEAGYITLDQFIEQGGKTPDMLDQEGYVQLAEQEQQLRAEVKYWKDKNYRLG